MVYPQGRIRCRTRLLGRHNVYNMLSAFAVAYYLGMAPERIAAAFWKLTPVSHRLELKRGGAVTIIDDAFNSNPAGAESALEVLSAMPGGQKIIITPGMVESVSYTHLDVYKRQALFRKYGGFTGSQHQSVGHRSDERERQLIPEEVLWLWIGAKFGSNYGATTEMCIRDRS